MFQFEIEDALDGNSKGDAPKQPILEIGFELGERIRFGNDLGVVKYVGAVGSHPGIWLGIEWDDSTRGKHSGGVDSVEYFTVNIPNSASFIRPAKAQKLRNLMEALNERYGENIEMSTVKSIEDRLEKNKFSYLSLKVLNLSSKGVNDLEDWELLTKTCPNVEVLEISDNLIADWDSIGKLTLALKKLFRIDLSRNPIMAPTENQIVDHNSSFPKLQHMILGGVGYDWNTVLKASSMWPQVDYLTVPYNKISEITSPTVTLLNLTRIDLEKNSIVDWNEVLKLNILQKLESINLCGNQLSLVKFPQNPDGSNLTIYFPNLVRLNLTENCIQGWGSVSEMDILPKLIELRIDLNPFLNLETRNTNRQIIIACLPKLSKLEGVDINRQERRDAELDYVKMYYPEWEKRAINSNFISEHPRYETLAKQYGLFQAGESVASKSNSMSMKSSLINLIIVPESALSYKECEKKILKTMTVQKLKGLLHRMFKIPSVPIEITVVSCQNPVITFVLDDDFMELGQYSVDDGDTLRIRW